MKRTRQQSIQTRSRVRRLALLSCLAVLAAAAIVLLAHPRTKASLRWKSGFMPLEHDWRVYHESQALDQARAYSEVLTEAIARVERMQGRHFKSGFRLYVYATHASFVEHLGLPPGSPVRGMVMRDIWLSPLAFDFYGCDTHQQSLVHELSHLHFRQHLGWIKYRKNVPAWFAEGLADVVADTGGEIVTREMALASFAFGRHFDPDSGGRLLFARSPSDYGVPAPLLHQQARMFVEYLRDGNPVAFGGFLASILQGAVFSEAFVRHLGMDLESAWRQFLASLA